MNIDCDNYKQVVEVETGEEFECPICHQHLEEVGGGKNTKGQSPGLNPKLIGIIAAVVVVLCGLGAAAYFLMGDKGPTGIKLEQKELVMTLGGKELLKPAAEPEGTQATFTFKASGDCIEVTKGGEVTALKVGEATITIKCQENKELRAICKVTVNAPETEQEEQAEEKQPEEKQKEVEEEQKEEQKEADNKQPKDKQPATKPQNGYVSNYNLGYGTYTGDIKNGKPHGHGTIVYRTSHTITGSYVASPGDKYEGDFRDGRVSGGLGYWTHNGNMKTINP